MSAFCAAFSWYAIALTAIVGAILAKRVWEMISAERHKETFTKALKESYENNVVYLYMYNANSWLPNVSPYCVKIEFFLRYHKIKYEVG